MRRIDIIAIGIGIFLAGGGLFVGFRLFGLDGISAGIWSQAIMVGGVVAWLSSYLFRVVTHNMTLNQPRAVGRPPSQTRPRRRR